MPIKETGTVRPDPARILEWLTTPAWLADREKVLTYINAAGRERADITAAAGRSIVDACHNADSIAKINALYDAWAGGDREALVLSRPGEDGRVKYNILIPVHGPDGFEGVLELSFSAQDTGARRVTAGGAAQETGPRKERVT
jgi:hypothetical protein